MSASQEVKPVRFAVIVFPGSSGESDCYHALREVSGAEAQYVWHEERSLEGFSCVLLPGGSSYGDYLRPGAIARYSPVMDALAAFARKGGLVIGIGNGFQILCEAGLLPGVLMQNASLRFRCESVHVKVERVDTPFTSACRREDVLELPIAHRYGRYYADAATVARLEANRQIVFRYASPAGKAVEGVNPSGSVANIAGIVNERGNVLGMMPHPERCVDPLLGSGDGKRIFESVVRYMAAAEQGEGRR